MTTTTEPQADYHTADEPARNLAECATDAFSRCEVVAEFFDPTRAQVPAAYRATAALLLAEADKLAPPLAGATGEGEKAFEFRHYAETGNEAAARILRAHANAADGHVYTREESGDGWAVRESVALAAVAEVLTRAEKAETDAAALRAKLATEDERERELLKRDKERQKLHRAILVASSGRLSVDEREAYASNTNGQGTRGAFGAGEIMGRVSLAQDLLSLFAPQNDGGPLLGDSGKEGRNS